MKGNSKCHTFTSNGISNYEKMSWGPEKCEHQRSIGKGRKLCMKKNIDCDNCDSEKGNG